MNRRMGRCTALMACVAAAAPVFAADAAPPEADFWPRWQARLGVSAAPASRDIGTSLQGAGVLGDYYFTGPGFGAGNVAGGFRATTGVFAGSRATALSMPMLPTTRGLSLSLSSRPTPMPSSGAPDGSDGALPYLGVGYSGVSLRGGWGFTADVGLMGAGARFGGAAASTQGPVDELLRELRLTPVIQLGVSYSF